MMNSAETCHQIKHKQLLMRALPQEAADLQFLRIWWLSHRIVEARSDHQRSFSPALLLMQNQLAQAAVVNRSTRAVSKTIPWKQPLFLYLFIVLCPSMYQALGQEN